MISSSLSIIKKELQSLSPQQLIEVCISLSKFKKENKELVDYLLFKANNEEDFIKEINADVSILMQDVHYTNIYLAKKSIRKILKTVNKYLNFSKNATTKVEIMLHFCRELDKHKLNRKSEPTLYNLYQNQLKKIRKEISKMHEDLQFDYEETILALE